MPVVGAGNRLSALGASQVAAAGTGWVMEGDGFASWVKAAASPLFVHHPNEAAGSENLTMTLARVANYDGHEATYGVKPSHVMFHAGRNNMGVEDLPGHMALVEQIMDGLLDRGMLPIVCQLPPIGDGSLTAGRTWRYSMALSHMCRKRNIPFLGLPLGLVSESGGGLVSSLVQADNVHLNNAGAKFYGTHLGQKLREWTGVRAPWEPVYVYANDAQTLTASKLLNPLMLTDSNADGVPDSWNLSLGGDSASVTKALVDGGPFGIPGNVFKLTKTATSADSIFSQVLQTPITPGNKIAVGYKIWFEYGSGTGNRLWIDVRTQTGSELIRDVWWPDSDWMSGAQPAQMWFSPLTIPVDTTSLTMRLISTAVGSVYFAQPTIVDLTAGGIATYV